MLWIALYLPHLPLQVFLRGGDTRRPLAVVEERRILAVNGAAAALGVHPGMGVASAQALAPQLLLRHRDCPAEAAALGELAAWGGQFTPQVSIDAPASGMPPPQVKPAVAASAAAVAPSPGGVGIAPRSGGAPDGLLLEVAASLRLFGGLESLQHRIAAGCAELGFAASLACAPTPLAARLLARAGGGRVTEAAGLPAALAPLSIALIDWAPEARVTLAAIGATTLGEVLALPREGLARRCGVELLAGLDRALGRRPDPRRWFAPPEKFRARLQPLAPVAHSEAVLFAARRLLGSLAGFLAARQAGVERFVLILEHDNDITPLTISLAGASRDEARFVTVLRERLAALALPAPVIAVGLAADEIRPLSSASASLFEDPRREQDQCAELIERLRARLGAGAVTGMQALPAHRPERAWGTCAPGTGQPAALPAHPRPLWLLEPPQPLEAANDTPRWHGPLTLLAGPERIESGWWDGNDVARDYYIARGTRQQLLWLFRERRAPHGWYLHGVFA
jgi:protein ImuB